MKLTVVFQGWELKSNSFLEKKNKRSVETIKPSNATLSFFGNELNHDTPSHLCGRDLQWNARLIIWWRLGFFPPEITSLHSYELLLVVLVRAPNEKHGPLSLNEIGDKCWLRLRLLQ